MADKSGGQPGIPQCELYGNAFISDALVCGCSVPTTAIRIRGVNTPELEPRFALRARSASICAPISTGARYFTKRPTKHFIVDATSWQSLHRGRRPALLAVRRRVLEPARAQVGSAKPRGWAHHLPRLLQRRRRGRAEVSIDPQKPCSIHAVIDIVL